MILSITKVSSISKGAIDIMRAFSIQKTLGKVSYLYFVSSNVYSKAIKVSVLRFAYIEISRANFLYIFIDNCSIISTHLFFFYQRRTFIDG